MSSDQIPVNARENKGKAEKSQKGASLVEYALLVALIAVIAIVAVRSVGEQTSQKFSQVSSTMNS